MTYDLLLVEKYRNKGIIVDTNLLLLLAVGLYDLARIGTFKRTNKFNIPIFEAVKTVVEQFQQRYTTPYIITELDNLSRMLPMNEWLAISAIMRQVVPSFIEVYERSDRLFEHALHAQIGVTDCSIELLPDTLIFTDDLPFAARMQGLGRDVLNVGHLVLDVG